MLKRLTFVLLLIPFMLILTQCSGDESTTNPIDPPAGFSGIRLTDKLGNILTGDSLDWCFPESLAAVPQLGTRAVIPTAYAFYPAYPNPNTEPEMRDISIVYDLPVAGEVEL
ncbi:MAG: hypothetical protein GY841_14315, partial [FCB group bacterium]|nr:hypothetical protein [FCB group bacterium]